MGVNIPAVNIPTKLDSLKDHLNDLAPDDAAFISEMVTLRENGRELNRHQILRIVDMAIPGEQR
jgi:hypothetical protein